MVTTSTAPAPAPPEPPDPRDCCGSGCQRCILDVYQEQLDAWRQASAAVAGADAAG